MKLTVKQLRAALANVPDDADVVFQGNVDDGAGNPPDGEPKYTVATGYLYSAWLRDGETGTISGRDGGEFVLDCAITDLDGGIL